MAGEERESSAGVVFVVDDDASVCEALSSLLRAVGWQVQTFATAAAFLEFRRPDLPACLVLDVRLPGAQRAGPAAPAGRHAATRRRSSS